MKLLQVLIICALLISIGKSIKWRYNPEFKKYKEQKGELNLNTEDYKKIEDYINSLDQYPLGLYKVARENKVRSSKAMPEDDANVLTDQTMKQDDVVFFDQITTVCDDKIKDDIRCVIRARASICIANTECWTTIEATYLKRKTEIYCKKIEKLMDMFPVANIKIFDDIFALLNSTKQQLKSTYSANWIYSFVIIIFIETIALCYFLCCRKDTPQTVETRHSSSRAATSNHGNNSIDQSTQRNTRPPMQSNSPSGTHSNLFSNSHSNTYSNRFSSTQPVRRRNSSSSQTSNRRSGSDSP